MTIQQFIEAAIEGGYRNNWFDEETKTDFTCEIYGDAELIWGACPNIFLDPEAWKAVEKSTGKYHWELRMFNMIRALIKGKTLEEYIATL